MRKIGLDVIDETGRGCSPDRTVGDDVGDVADSALADAPGPVTAEPLGSELPTGSDRDSGGGRDGNLVGRLSRIEAAVAEFQRRSAHREAVIDRLHAENIELKRGFLEGALGPVTVDLIQLYDGISREAERLAGRSAVPGPEAAALLVSFADEVGLALEGCGVALFDAVPGEPVCAGVHTVSSVVATDDPALHRTIAQVLAHGLRETVSDRVRRPARVRANQFVGTPSISRPAESDELPAAAGGES